MWWRILVPSWNFFDTAGLEPILEVSLQGRWQAVPSPKRGPWWSFFFNPEGTCNHARENLYTRLLQESEQTLAVENLTSYRLVEEIAQQFAKAHGENELAFRILCGKEEALVRR